MIRKPSKASIKAKADKAELRSTGAEPGHVPTGSPLDPAVTAKPKHPGGRPSKYDPAFCERAIQLGSAGKSRTQIARSLGVVRQTLTDWEKAHSKFSYAMSVADEYAQAWWEDAGQEGIMLGKQFNGFVYSFQMKNRFRQEYSDKIDVKHDATEAFTALWQMCSQGKTLEATA